MYEGDSIQATAVNQNAGTADTPRRGVRGTI